MLRCDALPRARLKERTNKTPSGCVGQHRDIRLTNFFLARAQFFLA
jgi:hypothetical protein